MLATLAEMLDDADPDTLALVAVLAAAEGPESLAAFMAARGGESMNNPVAESKENDRPKHNDLRTDMVADLLKPYSKIIAVKPVKPSDESGDEADGDDDGEPIWPEDEAPLNEEEFSEAKEAGFTGEKKDKLGRRMCYADGKRVPCGPKPTARQQRWKDNSTHQQYQSSGEAWDTPKWKPAGVTRTGQRRWLDGDTGKIVYRVNRPKEPTAEEKRAAYEARAQLLMQPARVEIGEGTERTKTESSLARVFGDTDPNRVATILGVPPGSVVIAQGFQFGDGGQIYTAIQHTDTMSWGRTVTPEDDGTLTIENMSFFLKPSAQGSGFGTKTFSEQVRQGFLQGVGTIETKAGKGGSGSDKMNGYYTWARLGYDAPLEDSFKKRLPAAFRKAETVQDLMEMPGGSDYWKARGHEAHMAFDLTPGSRSLDVLSRYLQSKGQPPIDQSESVIAAREATIQERRKRQPSTQARNREKFIEQETAVWPTLGDTIAKQVNDDRYTTPIIEEFNRQYPESRARYMDSGEHPNVAITEALRNARNVVSRSVYLDALETPEGDAAKEAFQELADKHNIPNWGRYPVIGRTPVETVALTMASTMELQGAPSEDVRRILNRLINNQGTL